MRKSTHFLDSGKKLQKQRDSINGFIQKWCPILGLERWEVDSLYHLEHPNEWHPKQAGECCCDWRYKTVTIGFSMPKLADTSRRDLEYIVIHELCHVLVNQMRDRKRFSDKMMEHEERVVTELAWSFMRCGGAK